jgi:hypothetical protein
LNFYSRAVWRKRHTIQRKSEKGVALLPFSSSFYSNENQSEKPDTIKNNKNIKLGNAILI